jgi:hypothetical protein
MITHGLVTSFLLDILRGVHQPEHVYRIALYAPDAQLGPDTQKYLAQSEVVGAGYVNGGQVLKGQKTGLDGKTAFMMFDNPTWANSSILARAALIYNYTANNRAIGVIDLGQDYKSTNGPFTVMLDAALIRIN